MVQCPSCATPNQDGSRFCNNCGAPLPAAAAVRRCPVCQTTNPAGNVRCDNCGTRLAPATTAARDDGGAAPAPVKGLQLPKKDAAATPPAGDDELDWLRQLGGSEPQAPAPAPEPEAAPAEDLPEWLKMLGTEPRSPAPAAQPPAAPEPEVPEWLKGPGSSTPAAPPAEVSEWLRGASGGAPAEPASQLPDWLQGLGASAPPAAPRAPAEPEPEVPSWLKGESGAVATPSEPDIPEWLRNAAGAEPAQASQPAAEPAEGTIPDWLAGAGAPPWEAPAAEPPAPRPAEPQSDLPEWLRSTEPAPAARPATPAPQPPEPPAAAPAEPELAPADLPDWLRGLQASAAAAPPPVEETPVASEDIPDWLAAIPPAPQVPAPGSLPADLPDWLRDLAPEPPAEETPPPARPAPAAEPPRAAAPPPARPGPAAEPPRAAPESPPAATPPFHAGWETEAAGIEPATEPPAPAGEMPDWLKGMAADFDKPMAPGELPDWLSQAGAATGETAEPLAPADLPDWLRAARPGGAPEMPPAAPRAGPPPQAPVPAAPPPSSPATSGDTGTLDLQGMAAQLAPADIPDWLRAMRPDTGVTSEPAGGEWAAPAAAGGLAEATIPDWLQALKPRELREPGAAEAEPAGFVETAGILAGIRGVIAAEPIVAVPRQAPPAVQVTVEPVHEQLAELLQRLATEEVVAPPRRVSRAAEVRSAAMRGFVYVLVLAAALLPLLGSAIPGVNELVTPFFPDPLPAGALADRSVQAAYNAVEALGPGDPVLLGFDANPAGYGEMRPLAEALVTHLAQKNARLVVVSTQATGAALAERLILNERNYSAGSYSNLGYLSGGPLGLSLLAGGTTGLIGADFHGDPDWQAALAPGGLVQGTASHAALDVSRFKLIVVVTNDSQVLRSWVEQVHTRQPLVPMVAAMSAAGEPLALSYWRPDTPDSQLAGVISGVAGADRYERALGASAVGTATATRPARGLAQLAVAALIVIGVLVHGTGMLMRRGT